MRHVKGAVPVESLNGNHRLMLAIIEQAVSDYVTGHGEAKSAERYLFSHKGLWHAEMIGLEPEYVQRVVIEKMRAYPK
jgi:hypothetical protein